MALEVRLESVIAAQQKNPMLEIAGSNKDCHSEDLKINLAVIFQKMT